jgi:hypothetical protein
MGGVLVWISDSEKYGLPRSLNPLLPPDEIFEPKSQVAVKLIVAHRTTKDFAFPICFQNHVFREINRNLCTALTFQDKIQKIAERNPYLVLPCHNLLLSGLFLSFRNGRQRDALGNFLGASRFPSLYV